MASVIQNELAVSTGGGFRVVLYYIPPGCCVFPLA
jgi:hypothetical protein